MDISLVEKRFACEHRSIGTIKTFIIIEPTSFDSDFQEKKVVKIFFNSQIPLPLHSQNWEVVFIVNSTGSSLIRDSSLNKPK